jgi:hypothetical protein
MTAQTPHQIIEAVAMFAASIDPDVPVLIDLARVTVTASAVSLADAVRPLEDEDLKTTGGLQK